MTEDLILLDEVAKKFGLKVDQARRKAALGQLPIPAFRLGNARKGPLYVTRADLEAHFKERYEGAKKLVDKMSV
jgi:hypothetical protein